MNGVGSSDVLRSNYRLFDPSERPLCFVEDHVGRSFSDLESAQQDTRSKGNDVIGTSWPPGFARLVYDRKCDPYRLVTCVVQMHAFSNARKFTFVSISILLAIS